MRQAVTTDIIQRTQRAKAPASTWSRVTRLIEEYPDVKQVRLNMGEHSVTVGFYEPPTEETLNRLRASVRAGLAGKWDVSIQPDGETHMIHLHRIDDDTTEFHRAHP